MELTQIQSRIYVVRGEKVILDFDRARLYEVETRVFNQAIKRNLENFPDDFMFRLTQKEWNEISSSQIVMMENLPKNRTGKYLPYAFTEHGVTMAASVLKSPKARKNEHRHRSGFCCFAGVSYQKQRSAFGTYGIKKPYR